MTPYFSIIMPVTLAEYKNSAKDRKAKFIRAVNSVLRQTFQDWELVIVSDGCVESVKTFQEQKWGADPKVHLYYIDKERFWSGKLRNTGIEQATGEYIVYLDSDDIYLGTYLKELHKAIELYKDRDWYIVNEYRYKKADKTLQTFIPKLDTLNMIGTSNIVHKRTMSARWTPQQYGLDDYMFSKSLKKESDLYRQLSVTGYVVCHIPKHYDL